MVIKLLRSINKNHAISQVVSVLLVVGLVVSSMAAIIFWAMPMIEEKKMESEMQTIIYSFEMLDNSVENMLIEGYSAKRLVGFMCPNDKGFLDIQSGTDKLIIVYSFSSAFPDFDVSGLDDEDDNFLITYNGAGNFQEADIYFLDPGGDHDPPVLDGDYIVPTDIISSELNKPVSLGSVTTTSNLEGSILIDLFDNAGDTIPDARIWVFELGSMIYTAYYNPGLQKTIYQNGAIFSNGFDNRGLVNEPSFIAEEQSLGPYTISLRVVQLEGSSGASGRSTPRVGLDLKNNFKREQPTLLFDKVYNLKFQFFGKNKQTWIDYFTEMDTLFQTGFDANTVDFMYPDAVFILDSSLVEIKIG